MISINLIKIKLRKIIFYPYSLFKKLFLIFKKEINEYRYPLKKKIQLPNRYIY